ncbi:hypothetical protein GCM10027447_30080 [Glycomyces halotolerans]
MLAAEVLNAPVLDADGNRVGNVLDLRTRPDGGRLVVEGLVLSRRSIRLFGYERGDEGGPAVFTRLAAFLHRDTRVADLDEVELDPPHAVRLRVAWDDLHDLESPQR